MIYRFTGKKSYALWGQLFSITCFSLIALTLIRARSYWIGAAAAFAALAPAYVIAASRIRKHR